MIKINYVFDRKNKCTLGSTKGVIELRVYEDTRTYYITTKQYIKPIEWNKQTQRVNSKCADADDINFYLKRYEQDLTDLRLERKFKNLPFTINDVKNYFKKSNDKTSSYIKFVNDELTNDLKLTEKTKTQHKNTLRILEAYHKKDVLFSDLTIDFLDKFLNHLRGKKYKKNTIHKLHKNLKKYIDVAILKDYTDIKNPCKYVSAETENVKREVLTIDKIKELRGLNLEDCEERIIHVKNMFLFACYTGLRISDVVGLKTEFIKQTTEGFKLDFNSFKSKKRVMLPLYELFVKEDKTSYPEDIIKQYLNEKDEYLFPRIPEAKINETLKIIGHKLKLNFKITFHTGRHTFGTIMSRLVSLFELRDLMQHSSVKTTEIYVNSNEISIAKSLNAIDWLKLN